MKSEKLLEDIKSRLDIVEVIGDYVSLKKAGQNYKALCPFHPEKTPSFIVSPQKQLFHCFGCGSGGDIFGFVMKHENLLFEDALKLLAKKAGIAYEARSPKKDKENKDLLKSILRESSKFYADSLISSHKALSYLKGRAVSERSVVDFSLGYASKGWHSLTGHLREKGFAEALLIEAGVSAKGEKGIYDFMRDRIIFPIFDIEGDVAAFGGRVMDDAMPKYLNSPETPLFKKSETLYGLNLAKNGIREKGYVMVVEGYLDVLMCHQHGFTNAIAPLGTALTEGHLRRLKRFTEKALLTFDGDEAGVSAARRSISGALEQGFKVKILLLPEGQDPDSILREKGPEAVRRLLGKAMPPLEFLLRHSKGERADIIADAIAIISSAKDPIVLDELIRELSDRTRVREAVIREEVDKLTRGQRRNAPKHGRPGRPALKPYDEETLLLSAAVSFPEKSGRIFELIDVEELLDGDVKNVFGKMQDEKGIDAVISASSAEEQALISRLMLNPGFDPDNVDATIEDCIKKIIKRKLDEKIRNAEISGDLRLLGSLIAERQRLTKERLYERTV